MPKRLEKDALGTVEVPEHAYYGAQTVRAINNFPISGLKPHNAMVWGTVIIKKCAATANIGTGRLDEVAGNAVIKAADEVLAGDHSGQFVVDPFQAGAGTSHNMNVNEVLANRAAEILGCRRGAYDRIHPNDHVNMGQSTNDVFPTAMRLASLKMLDNLLDELENLERSLAAKGKEFDKVLKSGRTHLQDAVPIRLGQEFTAYSKAIALNRSSLEATIPELLELGIGGTAVGTGMNAEEQYIDRIVSEIARETGFPVKRSDNLIERMQNMVPFVSLSSALKGVAINLVRIANDLRLLASGPRTGFGEITLPPVQPGSSIMPGKVNPVMAEMTDMVAFQVIGADTTVTLAAQAGQLELNVMMPVIAFNLMFCMEILTNALKKLSGDCIDGIVAHPDRCRRYLDDSLGMATVLAPYIGYMAAAEVAKEAVASGRSITEVVVDRGILDRQRLEEILDPLPLTTPGIPGMRTNKQ